MRSLVLSHLDYCNGLLTLVSVAHLKWLQSLQNWAARIIFQVNRRHDPIPLITSLHWLPICQRILFKILLLVYKVFINQSPAYITNCLQFHQSSQHNLRSNLDPFRLTYPRTHNRAGDRTFTVFAAKEWNNIPISIKSASSVERFKSLLKTYLYPKY